MIELFQRELLILRRQYWCQNCLRIQPSRVRLAAKACNVLPLHTSTCSHLTFTKQCNYPRSVEWSTKISHVIGSLCARCSFDLDRRTSWSEPLMHLALCPGAHCGSNRIAIPAEIE